MACAMPMLMIPDLRQGACAVTLFASDDPPAYAWRRATMSKEPVAMRASRMAASWASVPELVKKLDCSAPGVICATFSASETMASLGYSVERCWSLSTCALTGPAILGVCVAHGNG